MYERCAVAGSLVRRSSGVFAVGLFAGLILTALPASALDAPVVQTAAAEHPSERGDTLAPIDGGIFEQAAASSFGLAQQTPHPAPRHTGFTALLAETGSDFKSFPRRRSTWVILGIGAGAAALAHPADDGLNARLAGSDAVGRFFAPGKWMGATYVQAGAAIGLYVTGRYLLPHADGQPRTNRVSHLGFDMLRAIVVSQAFTQGIKHTVRRDRPEGDCCAFPSGHSSTTFATAAVLERHFGYRGSWPMFLAATYVATSRLHDDRHFLSDVVFGASLGIATGWTVVGRHGRSSYALIPLPTKGGVMVSLTRIQPREPRQ